MLQVDDDFGALSEERHVLVVSHEHVGQPDEALDRAKSLAVDAVRIPVGYWIVDAPAGGGSNLFQSSWVRISPPAWPKQP